MKYKRDYRKIRGVGVKFNKSVKLKVVLLHAPMSVDDKGEISEFHELLDEVYYREKEYYGVIMRTDTRCG